MDDNILYKYRNWDDLNQKRLLTHNEIYLASPKDFNDPFDCQILPNFTLLSEEQKKNFIKDSTIASIPYLLKEGFDINIAFGQLQRRMNDIVAFQKEYEVGAYEKLCKYYGVFSLSCRWNSILMWSHYANNHRGFCVGFDKEKLRKSKLFGIGKLVDYRDDFLKVPPVSVMYYTRESTKELALKETTTKAADWKYEEEYRFIKFKYPEEFEKSDRVITLEQEFLKEVIIGLNINKENQDEIIKIANSKNLPVFKIEKVPLKFGVRKVQIV